MSRSDTVLLFDAGTGTVSTSNLMASMPLLKYHDRKAQGGRATQEDRYIFVLPNQFPAQKEDKLLFFAVYDGQ